MKQLKNLAVLFLGLGVLQACGSDHKEQDVVADAQPEPVSAPQVTFKPTSTADGTVSSPVAPFSMAYRVIGTPVVGVPVAIEVSVDSKTGAETVSLGYAINDTTALQFPASQPELMQAAFDDERKPVVQQLTVVPQREGRHYVNVSASVETADGSQSLVMAVPVQVGGAGPDLEQLGEDAVEEDGDRIRVLKGEGG